MEERAQAAQNPQAASLAFAASSRFAIDSVFGRLLSAQCESSLRGHDARQQ
jgi:hypothetical protein